MEMNVLKIKNIVIMLLMIILSLQFTACSGSGNVLPENTLKTLTPKKILELAAEKYGNDLYNDAAYYYSNIIVLFPEDNDANNESRAWATYELGYIKYQQGDYIGAVDLFEQVIRIKTQVTAPQLLAAQMREKINNKMKK